jgi:hypothetical protein
MIKDINRISLFIKSNDGKEFRNLLLIIATIIISLLVINRIYLINFVNDDFKIVYNQSKLLFKDGISPYGNNSKEYISQIADEEGWTFQKDYKNLGNPIFQYFILYPFRLIENYAWSQAVFITFNQICVILSAHMLFSLLKIKPKIQEILLISIISSFVFFAIFPLMSSNVSGIQLVLCVGVLYFSERKNTIISGILLGCTFLDPIGIFYLLLFFFIILFIQKKQAILIWTLITITLLTIFSFIFDKNWIVGWLKYLFLSPSRYPFISFLNAAEKMFNIQLNRLFSAIPIFLGLWVIYEMMRTPKNSITKTIWLFSILGIANHYLMVQVGRGTEIFFYPALILLVRLWWKKINMTSKIILCVFLEIFSFGLVIWRNSLTNIFEINYEGLLAFSALFLIINLYWIRPWVMKPYEIETEQLKYY